MAYTTARSMISEIHKSLKQAFDDSDISFAQAAHWTMFFVNKLAQRKLGQNDSGLYLSVYPDIPVQIFTTSVQPNQVEGRKYIILPNSVHDFDLDRGVKYIAYSDKDDACMPSFAGATFTRTSPTKAKRLYFNPYEVPAPNNPYFYRVRNYIYLLGIENISVRYVEAGLYTTFDPFAEADLDQPLWLDEGSQADVFKLVMDLGRFVMLVPEETINEGANSVNKSEIPTQKIISVNDPNAQ